MADTENIIKGLHSAWNYIDIQRRTYESIIRGQSVTCFDDTLSAIDSARELLKAQEPIVPTIGRCEEYDGYDSWWYECGKCHTPIDPNDKYCRNCGREVKWND